MIPSTSIPLRIGALYHRRPTTAWSPKEVAAYKQLVKAGCFNDPSDLELVELYYATEKKKGDKGIHRRDLQTLLNNWQSEVDRAKGWREKIKKTPRGYGTFKDRPQGTATNGDFKEAHVEAKKMIEQLRQNLKR